jgi:lipoyl(octanoyl) transferase
MLVQDLGLMPYRDAWRRQEQVHADVLDGAEEHLLLVEHPPVITFGRRPGVSKNIIAPDQELARLNVEVVESDRGGDVTFHGPGQLVAYPILRLIDHKLSVGTYVHRLEDAVVAALKQWSLPATKDPAAVGIWVEHAGVKKKICALGVRIRRGVSMHGIALNVTTDLSYFNLIIPCGLVGKPVTSLAEVMGNTCPPMPEVKRVVSDAIRRTFPS